jgi:hypothetical protein
MMDVHLAEPGRRLWRVLLAVPHAVADRDHRVFDVLHLESEGFLDPKILHDLGLTVRYNGENRFEVDGANAAREFLKERGISAQQAQLVWDAIALHTTPTLALHKEPEVVMTHSGIAVDVLGAGLDRISREKQQAILTAFPRLAFKDGFKGCLCNVVRQKPMTAVDNILRDFGIRYVEGFTPPNFADLVAGAPFSE